MSSDFAQKLHTCRIELAEVASTGGQFLSSTWRAFVRKPDLGSLGSYDRRNDPHRRAVPDTEERPTMFQQLREDWQTHGRQFTSPGFQAVAVHRFGNWRMTIKRKAFRVPFSVLYRGLYRQVRNRYGIELPYSAKVGRRVRFEHQNGIVIHGSASIGDDCIIRHGVTLGNRRLDRPLDAPTLGRRVNVGAGAKILGGIVIGDDACVGANAVVCCDVPPNCHAVGVPARILFPEATRVDVVTNGAIHERAGHPAQARPSEAKQHH